MKCGRCDRTLRAGETAYEQNLRVINVAGTRVTERDVVVVVCEACSVPDEEPGW